MSEILPLFAFGGTGWASEFEPLMLALQVDDKGWVDKGWAEKGKGKGDGKDKSGKAWFDEGKDKGYGYGPLASGSKGKDGVDIYVFSDSKSERILFQL